MGVALRRAPWGSGKIHASVTRRPPAAVGAAVYVTKLPLLSVPSGSGLWELGESCTLKNDGVRPCDPVGTDCGENHADSLLRAPKQGASCEEGREPTAQLPPL